MTRPPSEIVPPAAPSTPAPEAVPDERERLLANLRAVVVALDNRTVHPERAGEEAIAADAQALRSEAVERIDRLERDDPAR